MRHIVKIGLCLMLTSGLMAQEKGVRTVVAAQTIQQNNYTIQVGIPFLGTFPTSRTTEPVDIRFPWDVLYLPNTFAESDLEISKGYYGDKVQINWLVRANLHLISNISLYRRVYDPTNGIPYTKIATVANSVSVYEDRYIEGGVLYEYKIVGDGIQESEERFNNFITGIGFRSPTATVTGNVSFEGGNAVKNVTVLATTDGSSINKGAALRVAKSGRVEINKIQTPLATGISLQGWFKPESAMVTGDEVTLFVQSNHFDISSGTSHQENTVKLKKKSETEWQFLIGGQLLEIKNYIPSGALNARGEDILVPIEVLNTSFTHITALLEQDSLPKLFINGRAMSTAYSTQVNGENSAREIEDPFKLALTFEVASPTGNIQLFPTGVTNILWDAVKIGGGAVPLLVDEIRIWNKILSPAIIRVDYTRYIGGNDENLVAYIRANERVGNFAYDLSTTGFDFHVNHASLENNASWATDSNQYPTSSQLGVLGVTDENGNYEITSIPYSGTGESFKVTPLFGVHQFEPNQQLVFLGNGASVVNKIDFVDISSFSFKGKVMYDTRGVFKSFVEVNSPDGVPNFEGLTNGDQYVTVSERTEGYNYYETISHGIKSKGEYWRNDSGTPENTSDDYLERYAKVFSEGVSVYIDGNVVLDENNMPVVSDIDGCFEISVPIGNHYISVGKNGHEFGYEGRFPEESGSFKEFFEDSNEAVVFVDKTRVTLIGKVVGGSVEAIKPTGFGADGLFQKEIENEEIITISSKNNIGIAAIKLGYIPPGSTQSVIETEFNFTTNGETGEYRVSVLPLEYQIHQLTGLKIVNNVAVSLLETNETVNLSEVKEPSIPSFEYPDGTLELGIPYQYEKSFTYRNTPVLRVISQTSEEELEIDGVKISTEGFEFPVYNQFTSYAIVLNSFEPYVNYDGDEEVEDRVPIIDGEFKQTNNLALEGTELVERDPVDPSIIKYSFKGGLPSISPPFTRTLDLKYRINGIDYEAENYTKVGIILGGQSDGSQTFTTAAPDVPDIILRDPPGSNSFASIESGESISFTTKTEFKSTVGVSEKLKLMLGVEFAAGGGLAGPVIKTQSLNNVQLGLGISKSSTDGKSLTKTYHFNETISTSDDPAYVGANGDLYIGQSKNYFYGSYDDVQYSKDTIGDSPNLKLTNSKKESVFVSKQKAMYFVEEPSDTFFIFSQMHILESLIPGLELVIYNYQIGVVTEDDPGIQPLSHYVQQLNLWKKVILDNERSKYLVKNERDLYKSELNTIITDFNTEITEEIDAGDLSPGHKLSLKNILKESNRVKTLLDTNFEDNISFDAGVGAFTRSIETTMISSTSTAINLSINENVALELGFKLNEAGLISTSTAFFKQDLSGSLLEESKTTVIISYTLKDNDTDNLLSVDVVNLFDGNGPIFSTIGGVTSCPYEGEELTVFYNNNTYNPTNTTIIELAEGDRESLSYATQRVEVPLISVAVASVSNVSESDNAEFILLLENNSVSETDVYYELIVDNLSNPSNAIINIEPNGTVIFVPYGQKVEYAMTLKKSISDVYDYKDIKIVLKSRCDSEVSSQVLVSAHFVPSCSQVELNTPLGNWVFNRNTAFNVDGTVNSFPIKMIGFDVGFNTFKKIDLEYRLASSPTWTRLQSYYGSQDFYDAAILNNETEIVLISSASLNYTFDIVGLQLSDGNYELRARSTCTNNTEYISEISTGRVDLSAPQRFGFPSPIDGVLGVGEELRVSFNEPVFYNTALSNIEIKGQTNQLPINHNVSIHFEGENSNCEIESPRITSGDLTFEFWMKNSTLLDNARIITQEGGLSIGLDMGEIFFSLGAVTAKASIFNDGLFHHYTFTHKNSTGEIAIYQDDAEIVKQTGTPNTEFTNNNPLIIGGNNFIGNMHDLRLWNKTISLENAYARMYDKLIGNEANLIGYWPMTEGRGLIVNDKARFKHARLNADWDIKPKGNSYEFVNGQYLELDEVGFVQLTNAMDATISFWMKTGIPQEATLFSNGRGDGSDTVQSNGLANKWAINITTGGYLTLESEGSSYVLTSEPVTDDNWHHITLLFNRTGSLKSYVDAEFVASNQMANIGGFSGDKIWLGARGAMDLSGIETVDNYYSGKIDEFRLWSTLRNVEQISRDRFNEVDIESVGLKLYARMNAPDPLTGNGPRYFYVTDNQTVTSGVAGLGDSNVNYSEDSPAIKPERALLKFEVNYVINGDEMIIEPIVSDWASLEGQVLDITVHRMFDSANNRQQSPITWTAYVKRNEVSWFVEGHDEIVDLIKQSEEPLSFEITLLNRGGNGQPFEISNIPDWMSLSENSGVLAPDSSKTITVNIDKDLTVGDYMENLYLKTSFGFDEKQQVKLRVLAEEPAWDLNPEAFKYSMNIIGRVQLNNVLSTDIYDKVVAMVGDEIRGVAYVNYEEAYQDYFVYLTIYSNDEAQGERVSFRLWDASKGIVLDAEMDGEPTTVFENNKVLGILSKPMLFSNSGNVIQEISLNNGWTWLSFNVNDSAFNDLNTLTKGMVLEQDDRIMSHSPALMDTYDTTSMPNGWGGTISNDNGLNTSRMYKARLSHAQVLKVKGPLIAVSKWMFNVEQKWNWLPYPLLVNKPVREAMAYFEAEEGDVVKSQNLFAIYDPVIGWAGNLKYLVAGKGYMLHATKSQVLKFPSYSTLGYSKGVIENQDTVFEEDMKEAFKKYPFNMNVIVQLPEGYNQVFVYDNDGVLKGALTSGSMDTDALSFLTIYGELEEDLTFYVANAKERIEIKETIQFKSNRILGTIKNPLILAFSIDNIEVYPNPFIEELIVRLDLKDNIQTVKLEIYSVDGKLIFSENKEVYQGRNRLKLKPTISNGVYLLHISIGENKNVYRIIKE